MTRATARYWAAVAYTHIAVMWVTGSGLLALWCVFITAVLMSREEKPLGRD
jgi:hypothetical protein